ncbi:MAG: reverse transcriptase domain-containing protein [Hominilimicola sp.]
MKRVGYLYEEIASIENCRRAVIEAFKNKKPKFKRKNKKYLAHSEEYARVLSEMLKNKSFTPAPYRQFPLKDGIKKKERIISTTIFFPDQCLHRAVCQVLEKVLMRGAYFYSCSSIKGKGQTFVKDSVQRWFKKDKKHTKYCFKFDIKHFYESVDNNVLKRKLRRVIKDNDCLELLDKIIDNSEGLPIGTMLSPRLANFFLQDFDHYVKENCGARYYIRYADDCCIFASSKRELHKIRDKIIEFLKYEGLQLKGDWQVFLVYGDWKKKRQIKRIGRRVDYCGYAMSHVNTTLRKNISLRAMKNCRKLQAGRFTIKRCRRFMAYNGWLKHSDSRGFQIKYSDNVYDKAKEVISNYDREKMHNGGQSVHCTN